MVDPFPPEISSQVMLHPSASLARSRGTVVVQTDGQHELKKSSPRNDRASSRVRESSEGFTMVPSYGSLAESKQKVSLFIAKGAKDERQADRLQQKKSLFDNRSWFSNVFFDSSTALAQFETSFQKKQQQRFRASASYRICISSQHNHGSETPQNRSS